MSAPEWENVTEAPETNRLKVEGGWLYRCFAREGGTTMVFVPETGDQYGPYLQQIVEALDKNERNPEDY